MNYKPDPIDTAHVQLPAAMDGLKEMLAKNAHEIWAAQRIADGWSYGERRDDSAKTSPCLVPYEDLPESEKVYDRKMAIETIKVILALGYRVVPGEAKG